ncbi:hypothetical protein NHF50_04595 [Flavobacterium sp. NRK F10]|uniref:hypothetical protein n=1 Tax=Flavobacterium sp. NRK F10 TaxID=2954931 RepID=UPI0020901F00|nr:hypothetical protein [Flavobacterium sp. NRK F10]MCO6174317.1 hypothetical protein [Flavobacterium sp. NRK F10]
MKIAILGWGSLIWQPKELAYNKTFGWQKDGPILPIEFARISKDGRLTLVITENGTKVPVLFTLSNYHNLEEAILNLAVREGSGRNSIGSYDKNKDTFSSKFLFKEEIKNWIKKTDFDAVIWTNLGENWNIKNDKGDIIRQIESERRIEYLKELKGNKSVIAEEYIRRTPIEISTFFRKEIEATLNWTPILNE